MHKLEVLQTPVPTGTQRPPPAHPFSQSHSLVQDPSRPILFSKDPTADHLPRRRSDRFLRSGPTLRSIGWLGLPAGPRYLGVSTSVVNPRISGLLFRRRRTSFSASVRRFIRGSPIPVKRFFAVACRFSDGASIPAAATAFPPLSKATAPPGGAPTRALSAPGSALPWGRLSGFCAAGSFGCAAPSYRSRARVGVRVRRATLVTGMPPPSSTGPHAPSPRAILGRHAPALAQRRACIGPE